MSGVYTLTVQCCIALQKSQLVICPPTGPKMLVSPFADSANLIANAGASPSFAVWKWNVSPNFAVSFLSELLLSYTFLILKLGHLFVCVSVCDL